MDINGWSELKKWLIKHKALGENIDNPLYITRLNLSSKEIKELPGSIELLENLVTLDLSDNFLEALPESIKNLKKLINLNISKNNFKVLPEVLGELNLKSLNASGNLIENVDVLQKCQSLRVLNLSLNRINEINSLAFDNNLRVVNISNNFIKEISSICKSLCNVERLDISSNLIKEIPDEVSYLVSLNVLNAQDNQINKISKNLYKLPVEELDLSGNQISELKLKEMEDLEYLIIDNNPVQKIYLRDDFAPYLESFSADGCGLKEFLMFKSGEIKNLCYSSNELTELPEEIINYSKLEELYIDDNNIKDLPENLANLNNLKILYVEGNPLNAHALKVIDILHPKICDIKTKKGIVIEEAKETDLPEMAHLIGELFSIEKDFEIDFTKQLTGITKLYKQKGNVLLVARDNDKVVGMVTMQRLISSAEGDYIGHVEDLIVKENYRNMGIGSRLLNKIRSISQQLGYKRIQLAADIDNENAHMFYTRRGFYQTYLKVFHYKA
ncbi:GNAT family N-acetyltransferase [Lebetimonas sp. JS032]|uniref:GNAT family N-acetyltransferase n=1 Tax=Lebetimonas sp. JS032 TaxID=990070 RepID=UPI000466805E|nr:GNAT family N-acetyltransferase [Lebetimonas sp. JS032]